MDACPFCPPIKTEELIMESEYCLFIANTDDTLAGSGMIVPKQHRETVFDLTPEEFNDTHFLLLRAKAWMDDIMKPDGFTVGWNCYPVGGQTVPHAHLHVIPRFQDEPLAGKGLRHHLKQKNNQRTSQRI
ncbi:HIT domain-containing protein [Paenibacillus sp. LMG 31456]|uniref:HIT domain-containing protein n=1 Tax=Paenibacillus foliorum TaxID=2654974 RepID=A0A972GXL8_9BACL|nr:HIT domain-containing protein [Paenibacillus foliorum]NOU96404.1 HIT domain-containing protein [Paenibacillus foliorum]